MSNFLDKIKKRQQEGIDNPANGRDVAAFLENVLKSDPPADYKEDSGRGHLFNQILLNMSHHVVGVHQRNNMEERDEKFPSTPRLKDLHKSYIHEELPEKNPEIGKATTNEEREAHEKESARKTLGILKHGLTTASPTRVLTPHPTETLNDEAIEAVRTLRRRLNGFHTRHMKDGASLDDIDGKPGQKTLLEDSLKTLWENLTPPQRKMTHEEEGKRSISFAKDGWNAIADMMIQHRDAVKDLEEKHNFEKSGPPSSADLKNYSNLVHIDSWAGDRDSKPHATAASIENIIELSKNAVKEWREEDLTEIYQWLTETSHQNDAIRKATSDLEEVMNNVDSSAPTKEILSKLYALKESAEEAGVNFPKFEDQKGHETDFSKLDVAIVRIENFGSHAIGIHIRQNAEMHDTVYTSLVERLAERKLLPEEFLQDGVELFTNKSGKKLVKDEHVEAILNHMMENSEVRTAIKSHLELELAAIAPAIDDIKKALNDPNLSPEQREKLQTKDDFYETLKGSKVSVNNPDHVHLDLIAENASKYDLWKKFTFNMAVDDPNADRKTTAKGVEVSSLVEDAKSIAGEKDINMEALENKHFRDYHLNLHKDDPRLKVYDPESLKADEKGFRKLTVADAKKYLNLELEKGDENREVQGIKRVMRAGSDSRRGDSTAIGPEMDYAERETSKALLNSDFPMLPDNFKGGGSALDRDNPPSLATDTQTIQGRAMRENGPLEISRAVLSFTTHRLGSIHGKNTPEKIQDIDQVFIAGNVVGSQPVKGELREKIQAATQPACEEFRDILNDPRFAEFMTKASAAHIVKIANYSSRPNERVGTKQGGDFPQPVHPTKVRAISAAGARHDTGDKGNVYLGVEKFLRLPESGKLEGENLEEIAKTIRKSPGVQDTCMRYSLGIIGANMDTAWNAVDFTRSEDGKTVTNNKNGRTYHMSQLERSFDEGEGLKDKPLKYGMESADVLVLARMEGAYQRGMDALYELYNKVHEVVAEEQNGATDRSGKKVEKEPKTTEEARQRLLSVIPAEVAAEMEASRQNETWARELVSEYHKMMIAGEIKLPKLPVSEMNKDEEKTYNELYYALAVLSETGEHIPVSIQMPGLAEGITRNNKEYEVAPIR